MPTPAQKAVVAALAAFGLAVAILLVGGAIYLDTEGHILGAALGAALLGVGLRMWIDPSSLIVSSRPEGHEANMHSVTQRRGKKRDGVPFLIGALAMFTLVLALEPVLALFGVI